MFNIVKISSPYISYHNISLFHFTIVCGIFFFLLNLGLSYFY